MEQTSIVSYGNLLSVGPNKMKEISIDDIVESNKMNISCSTIPLSVVVGERQVRGKKYSSTAKTGNRRVAEKCA